MYKRNWNVQVDGPEVRAAVTEFRKGLGTTDKVLFDALFSVGKAHLDEIKAHVIKAKEAKEASKVTKAVARLEKKLVAAKAAAGGSSKPAKPKAPKAPKAPKPETLSETA